MMQTNIQPNSDFRSDASQDDEIFRLMVESVTDCSIIMLDQDGVIRTWNSGAQRIMGHQSAEIVGAPTDCFYLPEDIASHQPIRAIRQAALTGRFEDNGWRVRQDGTRFWANVVVTPIRDSHNTLRGYTEVTRDLTQQKSQEDAAMECEARLRAILDTVPDAIVTVDENGLIESFSAAASRLFGYAPEQVTGRNVKMLMRPPYSDLHDVHFAQYRQTGERRIVGPEPTVHGLRVDGSTFPMELTVGEARGCRQRLFTGFFRDKSERQRVEAELSDARATAEAANKAKSEFLSNMSHELRTPLNAILGFAQLMESDTPRPTPSQTASIDQILQAGWYLLTLINEVLDLSLIEAGKLAIVLEPLSVAEVFAHCQSMMEPIAQKRGITMTFPKFVSPCIVMADRTRLRQVFINLLTNAIKYNRPYGNVTVSANAKPDGQVRFSIRDTGRGLTPERIVQLYQPFNRLGQEAGPEQGTGIGLVVTKRLIEAMHGSVGVESEVGVGTVFWVDLVATQGGVLANDDPDQPSGSPTQLDGSAPVRTILYIEDNPANLKLIEVVVARRSDLRFLSANTGDLGLELALSRRPDVILTDILLPGTSGTRLMTILRGNPDTAHIPIIALSANADPLEVKRGIDAGFMRYLTKPINFNELTEAINLALSMASVPASTASKPG